MDFVEHVVAGSGPAGVAAATRLEQLGTVMLDVGEEPRASFPFGDLDNAFKRGGADALLGSGFELLSELDDPARRHVKLRAPAVRHVADGQPYTVRDEAGAIRAHGRSSTAAGGLANAWGAQLLRYTQRDLDECGDWPVTAAELAPHYDWLEDLIGISGAEDDLAEFLGAQRISQDTVPQTALGQAVLDRYCGARAGVQAQGVTLGLPRVAVLTRAHLGRPAHGFGQTEFFTSARDGIYSPRQTLSELRARGVLAYRKGHRLAGFTEKPDHVELTVVDGQTGGHYKLATRHLLMGCGTLQTARIVLQSSGQEARALPFLDQPPLLVPLFFPRYFGQPRAARSFPVQFIGAMATTSGAAGRDMLTFYYPGAVLKSELVSDVPLPVPAGLRALDILLGGMLVAQIWQAARPSPGKNMRLGSEGDIEIRHPDAGPYAGEASFLRAMRLLGGYSLPRWVSRVPAGWGFHYAGSLPMRRDPLEFQTHADGRLWNSRRIRAIDGSVLPSLPAKNHSLTIMANAARIAESTRTCGF